MLGFPNSQSVAVLIDADNIQLTLLDRVLQFANHTGTVKIKHAYGDWSKAPLSAWHNAVKKLAINTVQVNDIGKDSTDKQLMIEAGEILGQGQIDQFIIVSGDGDFRQLCESIKRKGRKVIAISNKQQSSNHLKDVCDAFHYLEELSDPPAPMSKSRLRKFEIVLTRALVELQHNPQQTIGLGHLGNKMREIDPNFEQRFGDHRLSEWLHKFEGRISFRDRKTAIILSVDCQRLVLLLKAHRETRSEKGVANVGKMRALLHQIDSRFDEHFKGKFSKWLDKYPHIFTRKDQDVRLAAINLELICT